MEIIIKISDSYITRGNNKWELIYVWGGVVKNRSKISGINRYIQG